jgi:hypothetical protein
MEWKLCVVRKTAATEMKMMTAKGFAELPDEISQTADLRRPYSQHDLIARNQPVPDRFARDTVRPEASLSWVLAGPSEFARFRALLGRKRHGETGREQSLTRSGVIPKYETLSLWFDTFLKELTDKFGGATSFLRGPGRAFDGGAT